jgi:hypothetical protein
MLFVTRVLRRIKRTILLRRGYRHTLPPSNAVENRSTVLSMTDPIPNGGSIAKLTASAEALEWAKAQPAWWHDSGNLGVPVLETLCRHNQRIGAKYSAETGCGLSTVILSNLVERHLCFTIAAGNSLSKVQAAPHIRQENVSFVVGPSQLTLPRFSFPHHLDSVLIDGAHGFPFAQLDYNFLYPHIRRGGLLVVDDIHIPVVKQLYEVLKEDAMWKHLEDVVSTAFFERTNAPLFDPQGDGWWLQGFNKKHFKDRESLESSLGEKWWER